jgi:hypothetical protein
MANTHLDPGGDEYQRLAAGVPRQRDARESIYCADPKCGAIITAANDWRFDDDGRRIHRACGR